MTEPPESSENAALRAEFDRRATRIRAMSDRRQAFRELAKLGTEMDDFASEVARLRTEIAGKLREDGLSLQQIADLIGVERSTIQDYLGKKKAWRERRRNG